MVLLVIILTNICWVAFSLVEGVRDAQLNKYKYNNIYVKNTSNNLLSKILVFFMLNILAFPIMGFYVFAQMVFQLLSYRFIYMGAMDYTSSRLYVRRFKFNINSNKTRALEIEYSKTS